MGCERRPRIPALLLLLAVLASCGYPSRGDPSRGDLPADPPAEGIGRAEREERTVGVGNAAEDDPAKQAGHEIFGVSPSDGPAFEAVPGDGSEDIDLTGLSTGALYVTVGKMKGSPEPYVGKTVRMAGYFESEQTDSGVRYTCSVPDMAGCCFESVEIRCAESPGPDGVPADGTVVTVSGRFGIEQVNEYLHYTFLSDAVIEDGG